MSKQNRIAFVAGGSGAIGSAVCRALAQDGYRVAIGYYRSKDKANAIVKECASVGLQTVAVPCDVTDTNSMIAARAQIENLWEAPDTLVYCAGTERYRLLRDEDDEGVKSALNSNLFGAITMCRLFSPDMVSAQWGRIVLCSSVWGVRGASMETVYSAAKAGVIHFGKALADELAPSSVTVNIVSPGFIDTPMNARFTAAEREAILEEIPVGRFGTCEDVAVAVRFLCSEQTSYITGQNIVVAGGYKNI